MSEQVEEQEVENGGDGAPEVDLPEGWDLVHHRPEELIELSGTQGRFQVNPAQLRAEKQINGSLVNAQGSTPEELQAAVQAVEESVQAFKADPHAAPLAEAPTTATRMTIPVEDGIPGDAEAEEIEINPNTVITNEGSFTEEEWAARSRTDTIVTDEGQMVYSGAGEHADEITQALDATAAEAAAAENEQTKEAQAEGVESKQVVYSTADMVDSPGQSAGGTIIVPADTNSLAEAAQAMAATAQEVENERVAETAEPPAPEGDDGEEGEGEGSTEATPAAAKAAADLGVDLASVEGSGEGGKVTKADVEAAAASNG